ncbi:MAG: preprotein translocase subunit SecE [Candidatus Saccharimonadales bacterium]
MKLVVFSKKKVKPVKKEAAKVQKADSKLKKAFSPLKKLASPFIAFGQYFKGSWQELRQVRWPNRSATWGLTAAVVLFSGFFFLLIVLLDDGFQQLFKLIIK